MGIWRSSSGGGIADVEMGNVFAQPPGSYSRPSLVESIQQRERILPAAFLLALSCFSFLVFCYHLGLLLDLFRFKSPILWSDLKLLIDLSILFINTAYPVALVKIPKMSCGPSAVIQMGLWPLSVLLLCPFSSGTENSSSLQLVHLGSGILATMYYFSNTALREYWLCRHLVLFQEWVDILGRVFFQKYPIF